MKRAKKDIFDAELDEEERAISDAFDRAKPTSVNNLEEEVAFARNAAANHLRKDARVTLRLSSLDLSRLKQAAAHKGLHYQTLMASVLHQYAAGHFREIN